MDAQFIDRILNCADCHGEFIFTAGEQLFFYDKQFKNDPKRCKPCKSRRSGLAAAANGAGLAAAGLSRTETRTLCSECGIETTVPFKPTQGRPVLCRQCFQTRNRAVAAAQQSVAAVAHESAGMQPLSGISAANSTSETIAALTQMSMDSNGATISADDALMAASSMASATAGSSVASAADLASIAAMDEPELSEAMIPRELLSAAHPEGVPAQLLPAMVEALDA